MKASSNSFRLALSTAGVTLALLPFLSFGAGCARDEFAPVTYLSPMYLDCIEVKPADLTWDYFGNYADRWLADRKFTGKTFIFKNITVTSYSLENKDEGFMWVEQLRCAEAKEGDIAKLKVGEQIDIIGVNRGVPPQEYWALLITDCIFVPADSLGLPLPGGDVFVPTY